jgi:hypothetical protein
VFADPETGVIAGLWRGGDHGDDTQETNDTNHCHDITVFPAGSKRGDTVAIGLRGKGHVSMSRARSRTHVGERGTTTGTPDSERGAA